MDEIGASANGLDVREIARKRRHGRAASDPPVGDRPARARTRDLQPMRGFGFFLTTTTS
jgi:hypothetical protein